MSTSLPSSANSLGHPIAASPESAIAEGPYGQQLQKILQSSTFRGAESLRRFLQYAVERTLHGEGDQLKEYRIGVEVFHRVSAFDPRLDPVVRMTARRLRTKLDQYYQAEGREDPIKIELPKGSYAVTFRANNLVTCVTSRTNGSGNSAAPESPENRGIHLLGEHRRRLRVASAIVRWRLHPWLWPTIGVLALVIVFVAWWSGVFRPARNPGLTTGRVGKLLIADVANNTGETVFDDTLKQAIAVDLGQSPLLDVVSDTKVHATLTLMSKPAETRLTPELARDVCQRTGSSTFILGSIEKLGSSYVLGLSAVNCLTGDSVAQEQSTARDREHVLNAMDEASRSLRQKLGESLSTIQKFDVPLEQATTPSLEALKAYSLGNSARDRRGEAAAVPFFNHAVELDPNFALAYAALGISYSNLEEPGRASENISKAFEKRQHASERERFEIAADYSQIVTGELDKANEICEVWAKAYPRDEYPHDLLGVNYEFVGKYEDSIAETSEAIRLNPDGVVLRSNLMDAQIALNRIDDAKATYRLALERNLDHPYLHADMYGIAFLEGDKAEMARQFKWASRQPDGEDLLLSLESDSKASFGNLREAREDSRRASESASRNGRKEAAALWRMNSALREAELGNAAEARDETTAALKISSTRDVKILAALTLARANDPDAAQALGDELASQFPLNLVINRYWLPTIRAAIYLDRGEPSKAVEVLKAAGPYQLGYPNPQLGIGRFLYPKYLRGEALLRLGYATEAISELREFAVSSGLIGNSPLRAPALLRLARAYLLTGDRVRARDTYHAFATLWRNADQDISLLKRARKEFANLE